MTACALRTTGADGRHEPPATAALLADALLALHVGIVLFVVGLLPLVLVGGACGWRWVRHRGLRITHLGLMLFIAAQAWLGRLCPLTVWEQDLRRDVLSHSKPYRNSLKTRAVSGFCCFRSHHAVSSNHVESVYPNVYPKAKTAESLGTHWRMA